MTETSHGAPNQGGQNGSGVDRRNFLKWGALATFTVPAVGSLAGCATGGSSSDSGTKKKGKTSDKNPLGIDPKAAVDVVIFDGGYHYAYAESAAGLYNKAWSGDVAKVSNTTKINTELQPRFVGGNPPDLIDDSGADAMPFAGIQDQVEDLSDLLDAPAIGFDGKKVKDVIIKGAAESGTFNGKVLQLNYFYTVFGVWYSAKLFKDKGFEVPTTWDEVISLGEKAKAAGLSLFTFGGQNAGNYYFEMAYSMAAIQYGKGVLKKIDRLDKDAFTQAPITEAIKALESAVKAGYFEPGGAGMIHTQAQTEWCQGKALLYQCGSWLEAEMTGITPADFEMTAIRPPALKSSPKLAKGFHGSAGEPFIVPSKAKNPAGGKEFLRQMLSKEGATKSAAAVKSPTIVMDTVPADGFGSSALASVSKIQKDGGDDVFNLQYYPQYGFSKDDKTNWSSFLAGQMSGDDLIKASQANVDKVREDPSVKKFKVS